MQTERSAFEQSPIFTFKRIMHERHDAFLSTARPQWVSKLQPEYADEFPLVPRRPGFRLIIRGKHPNLFDVGLLELAALYEITRFAHRVVVSPVSQVPGTPLSARIAFKGAPEVFVTVSQVFDNADPFKRMRPGQRPRSLNSDGYLENGPYAPWSARELTMFHVEEAVCERGEKGSLQSGFDVEAYASNIYELLDCIDGAWSFSKMVNLMRSDPALVA